MYYVRYPPPLTPHTGERVPEAAVAPVVHGGAEEQREVGHSGTQTDEGDMHALPRGAILVEL